MKDGFLKAAALSPALRVADCAYNTQQILAQLTRGRAARGVKLAVFPELCLTGYTCGDLFLQQHPAAGGAERACSACWRPARSWTSWPWWACRCWCEGKLLQLRRRPLPTGSCWAWCPRRYLPNYGEFYEAAPVHPRPAERGARCTSAGQQVPFGTPLLFRCCEMPSFVLGVEMCEDLWAPLPPSTGHALAGATVIANLSASDETVGKADYRRAAGEPASRPGCCARYLYADAGAGRVHADMVFAGHNLIAENGAALGREHRPSAGRLRLHGARPAAAWSASAAACTHLPARGTRDTGRPMFHLRAAGDRRSRRPVDRRRPLCPATGAPRAPSAASSILAMQADGPGQAAAPHAHAKTAVIGISGGLDSTPRPARGRARDAAARPPGTRMCWP